MAPRRTATCGRPRGDERGSDMATFDAAAYLRKHSTAPRTVVKHADGSRTTLPGIPRATTPDGLCTLAGDSEEVRVSLPKAAVETDTGTHTVNRGGPLSGKAGAGFLRGQFGKGGAVAEDSVASVN